MLGQMKQDALTEIKGIGKAREAILQRTLGVFTFQDLADQSVDAVKAAFKGEGHAISQKAIEEMIASAHQLAVLTEETFANLAPTKGKKAASTDWVPFASFGVELQARDVDGRRETQTVSHFMEGDISKTAHGILEENVINWMKEVAGETPSQPEVGVPASSPDIVEKQFDKMGALSLAQILLKQNSTMKTVLFDEGFNEDSLGFIKSDQSWQIDLQLWGKDNDQIQIEALQIQLFVRNLTRGSNEVFTPTYHLESNNQIRVSKTIKRAQLPPGHYRLSIMLREKQHMSSVNYIELPTLHII